jgi:hypothetical protein
MSVPPWGISHSSTGFRVELLANHPQGSGRVKAEIEACPPGVVFGNAGCTHARSPSWVAVQAMAPDVLLGQTVSGLTPNKLYRWRARVLHAPATGATPANPAHGPWRRFGAQTVEGDIRVPEPDLLRLIVSGAVLLAVLARRRSRVRLEWLLTDMAGSIEDVRRAKRLWRSHFVVPRTHSSDLAWNWLGRSIRPYFNFWYRMELWIFFSSGITVDT